MTPVKTNTGKPAMETSAISSSETQKAQSETEANARETPTISNSETQKAQLQQHRQPTLQQAQRIANLEAKIAAVESQIQDIKVKQQGIDSQLKNPNNAQKIVRDHIALLHSYNEIRDVGQGLMGLIADQRGVRIRDVYAEFGVVEGD